MDKDETPILYIDHFQMPFELVAVTLSQKIFPLGYTRNSPLIVPPWQFYGFA